MTWHVRDPRAMRQPRVPEKAEQSAIVQLLESLGAKVHVIGTKRRKGDYQGTMMSAGLPDLYVALPFRSAPRHYRALWIEVKAAQGRASDAQRAFGVVAEATIGATYIRGTCDDVQRWLVDHGWLQETQRRRA